MPMYRISDETHERLKRWAVPLSDTRGDVVRRVLDVAEGKAVEMESESLHFHTRSRLVAAIEEFLVTQREDTVELVEHIQDQVAPSRFVVDLAEHILSAWMEDRQGGKGNADRPNAG